MRDFFHVDILTSNSLGCTTIVYYILVISFNICLTGVITKGFNEFKIKLKANGIVIFLGSVLGIISFRYISIYIKEITALCSENNSLLDYVQDNPYILLVPGAFPLVNIAYDNLMEYASYSISFKIKGNLSIDIINCLMLYLNLLDD